MILAVGLDTYNRLLDIFPEMFKEEIEGRAVWKAVPEKVKEAYFNECFELDELYRKGQPNFGIGIMKMIQNPEKINEFHKYWNDTRPERLIKARQIHEKYLSKYNIKFKEDSI